MPSERIRRRVEGLLDDAETALSAHDCQRAAEIRRAAPARESENAEATAFLHAAQMALGYGASLLLCRPHVAK